MSIEIDPAELAFQGPFTREVGQTLHIKNPNHEPVAFKVKTTAPRQYCVRPNSGRIEAGRSVEIQVLLQALKSEPPADFKCRDKFLVQSIMITADREATNVQQIWNHVEETEKSAIRERKIRVVYLQPAETTEGAVAGGAEGNFDSSPPPYTSATPQPANSTPAEAPRPVSAHESQPPAADLSAELATAKATIARLQAELDNQGLRLRKAVSAAEDVKGRVSQGATTVTTQPHPEGIPVQICAGLCLMAFFIAWFFF